MLKHPFGLALYEPPKFEKLKPGMIGYINAWGRWVDIVDITDAKKLKAEGYTPFRLPVIETEFQTWGPHEAAAVNSNEIKFEGEVSAASFGFPADIGGVVEYSTTDDFGAILMCYDKVAAEGYDDRDRFSEWLRDNAKIIMKKHTEVKKRGVCAAMRTYSAKDIYIEAWDNPERKIRLGFKLGATGAGSVSPERSWSKKHSGNAWRAWDEGEKRVVFFTGVKFKFWGFLGAHEVRNDPAFRGGDEDKQFELTELDDGRSCVVDIKKIGKLSGIDDEGGEEEEEDDDDDDENADEES